MFSFQLDAVDPGRLLLLSMERAARDTGLADDIAAFAQCRLRAGRTPTPFPASNDTALQEALVEKSDLRRTELLLAEGWRADTEQLSGIVAGCPGLDSSRFSTQALYQ